MFLTPRWRHATPDRAVNGGKLYAQSRPTQLVRIQGIAPLRATVWELDRLRCNLCGEVFTAEAPPKVGAEKYDATAASMIGLLKYGCGLPFIRLVRLETSLGIPLPAASQWEVVQRAAGWLAPAYVELVRQAAQGEVLYNDDTTMKILGSARRATTNPRSRKTSRSRRAPESSPPASSPPARERRSRCFSPAANTPARTSARCWPSGQPTLQRRSRCATRCRATAPTPSTRC